MSNLLVNTRDQKFVLFEQLGIEKLLKFEAFKDFSKDDLLMILNEAEKMAVNEVVPTWPKGTRKAAVSRAARFPFRSATTRPGKNIRKPAGFARPMRLRSEGRGFPSPWLSPCSN